MVKHLLAHSDASMVGHTYWQVGNFKTISKIAAIEKAGGDITKVQFSWMENTWDQTNWGEEPALSWDDLLKIRCQQLRNKYDYLSLMYSGGWDSHTILMAFVRHKIPLDELIIWDKRSYYDEPELDAAVDTAKRIIADYMPTCKLKVYEIPWSHHGEVYKQAGENWIYLPGAATAFNKTHRIITHEAMPSFMNLMPNKKRVGYIEGVDKPFVFLGGGMWHAYHTDLPMYVYVGKGSSELFYFTPDLPELHVKQCYMAIRYFEERIRNTPGATHLIVDETQRYFSPHYAEWNRAIGRLCGPSPSAQLGSIKGNMTESPHKDEMWNLLKHTMNNDQTVFDIYWNGLQKIKDLSSVDVITKPLPIIHSKSYPMRKFQR